MKIYQRYEALSPIYQGGLTNHLPMVYTALKRLGLSDAEIVVRLDNYRDNLGIPDLTETTTPISEFEQEYINQTSYYLGKINHKGIPVTIGEFLQENKPYIGSALFHGLIRLAYAKEEDNELMIAQALAYYELSVEKPNFPIDPRKDTVKETDFIGTFYKMKITLKDSAFSFKNTRTSDKFLELLELDIVQENLKSIDRPNREMILELLLSEYEKTRCFYNLHLLTGFEALLELEEYIYDFDVLLNRFLQYAQVFLLFTTKEYEELKGTENIMKTFEELIEEVPNLTDAHDIKLFYSLLKLNKLFYNERLLKVANNIFNK